MFSKWDLKKINGRKLTVDNGKYEIEIGFYNSGTFVTAYNHETKEEIKFCIYDFDLEKLLEKIDEKFKLLKMVYNAKFKYRTELKIVNEILNDIIDEKELKRRIKLSNSIEEFYKKLSNTDSFKIRKNGVATYVAIRYYNLYFVVISNRLEIYYIKPKEFYEFVVNGKIPKNLEKFDWYSNNVKKILMFIFRENKELAKEFIEKLDYNKLIEVINELRYEYLESLEVYKMIYEMYNDSIIRKQIIENVLSIVKLVIKDSLTNENIKYFCDIDERIRNTVMKRLFGE